MKHFLLVLMLVGCGKTVSGPATRGDSVSGDETLIKLFYRELSLAPDQGEENKVKSLNFVDMSYKRLGVCTYTSSGNTIEIREDLKDVPDMLEAVFAHEFFHCTKNAPHYDEDDDIMNTQFNPAVSRDLQFYREKAYARLYQ